MSRKTDAIVAHTGGIDTGKKHAAFDGLDDKGAIVLREKLTRGRIPARLANVPQCLIDIETNELPVRLALTTSEAHDNRLAFALLSGLKSG
jgi:hypothetical protein